MPLTSEYSHDRNTGRHPEKQNTSGNRSSFWLKKLKNYFQRSDYTGRRQESYPIGKRLIFSNSQHFQVKINVFSLTSNLSNSDFSGFSKFCSEFCFNILTRLRNCSNIKIPPLLQKSFLGSLEIHANVT